jgi:4-amino-4-deoxy-L-arabinose transferase-like glycosyltransferase
MLESSLVFFMVATLWAWQHWLDSGRWAWLAMAAVGLALACLTKIYVLFVLAPVVAMAWRTRPWKAAVGALALAAAIMPAGAWYWHAAAAAGPGSPVANRVYYSVRSTVDVHRPPHPLLGSMAFYRRIAGDLLGPVLTPLGFALLVVGLANPAWSRHAAWLAGSVLLIVLLPRKFYEMNYYWLAVLPLLAIFAGLGWQLAQERFRPGRSAVAGWLVLAVLLAGRFTAGPLLKTAQEDRGVVAAGLAVQRLTRPDEPVVTMHGTTIDLLYYCRRPGWAIEPGDSETLLRCCRQGARVLAMAGEEPLAEAHWPGIDSQRLAQGPGFAVYRIARR